MLILAPVAAMMIQLAISRSREYGADESGAHLTGNPYALASALAKLDADYQSAVEHNDTKTMSRILADDFILVEGDGTVSTKADLLNDAASGKTKYEHQIDSERTIRVWGDTAVVTAKLWAKGLEDGKQVDYFMWFSDTYIRKPTGWSYVFGQASLALPKGSK